jgi:hypothetical protein
MVILLSVFVSVLTEAVAVYCSSDSSIMDVLLDEEVGRKLSHLNKDLSIVGMGVGFNEALIDLDLL